MNDQMERQLTLEEISIYFHLPQQMAAAKLSIPIPLLKSRCRELGIKRWPYLKNKRNSSVFDKYTAEFNHFKLEPTPSQFPSPKKVMKIKKIPKTEPMPIKITINQNQKLQEKPTEILHVKAEENFVDSEEDDFTKNLHHITDTQDGNLLHGFKDEYPTSEEENSLLE
eukprot:gene11415-4582_t